MRTAQCLTSCLTIALLAATTAATAQQTYRPILTARLGGDSAQAADVRLRAGARYQLELRPAGGRVQLRRGGNQPIRLDPVAVPDSVNELARYSLDVSTGGDYVVELLNPREGMRVVTLTPLSYLPGDAEAHRGQRILLYSVDVGGPVDALVFLDSGVVYRLASTMPVAIRPRMVGGAPARMAPLVGTAGGIGVAFMVPLPGEYRLSTAADSIVTGARIYQEASDPALLACVRNTSTAGCRGANPAKRYTGLLLAMIAVPIAIAMLK